LKKTEYFIKEFVIGLGFLSGLWIKIGINPEEEAIKQLANAIKTIYPNAFDPIQFLSLSTLFTILSIIVAYSLGGWLGLLAIGLAFIGGAIFGSPFSIILLIVAVILGFFAISLKK